MALPPSNLRELHTFGLEASADEVVPCKGMKDLAQALEVGDRPWLMLGEGSNVVFTEDFRGRVILNRFKGRLAQRDGDGRVRLTLGAGENWDEVVRWTLDEGWGGLENLSLIPGTVGAAPVQNIGAYGVELSDVLSQVRVWDRREGQEQVLSSKRCDLSYRHSIFKEQRGRFIITEVELKLPGSWTPRLQYGDLGERVGRDPSPGEVAAAVVALRKSKLPDPVELGNAGSFFKNPVVTAERAHRLKEDHPDLPSYPIDDAHCKIPAAWLIDRCGFKGRSHGGVRVHPQQALVLTNTGEGKGDELLSLTREILQSVNDSFGIRLEPEVLLMGENGPLGNP